MPTHNGAKPELITADDRGRLPPLQIVSIGDGYDKSREDSASPYRGGPIGSATGIDLTMANLTLKDQLQQDHPSAQSSASPKGAVMERENSMQSVSSLPDLDQLSRDKGRPLDVLDLDDSGWKAASRTGMILSISSLGEGAGGAVNKCRLRGGATNFALKVCTLFQITRQY